MFMSRRSPHVRFLRLLSIVLIAAQLLLLSGCRPAGPSAATPAASATPEATATLRPSSTPTPTLTPTPAPTSTPTPTLPPTPTPAGFVYMPNAGVSFQVPSNWEAHPISSQAFVGIDSEGPLVFMMLGEAQEKPKETLDVTDALTKTGITNAEVISQTQGITTVGDGYEAKTLAVQVKLEGQTVAVNLYYVYQDGWAYAVIFSSTPKTIQARSRTIRNILDSVRITERRLWDLPRDETLVMLSYEPSAYDLDPAYSTDPSSGYVGLMFSGLVRLTPELQLVPDLAESWTTSPDGTVYTFTLRADLMFADGKDLTAQDVKDSWERAAEPKEDDRPEGLAGVYLGDIVGVKDKLAGKVDSLEGVQVVDGRTLRVTLDGAKPYFLGKLAYPVAFVTDPYDAEVSPDRWGFTANASGPYQIKDLHEGEALILERNEKYHKPPEIRYLAYQFYSGQTGLSLYEAETLDIAYLGVADAARINKESDPLHDQLHSTTMMCTDLLYIDNTQAPLNDENVRKALAMAIDKPTLAQRLTEGLDITADTILPPGMPGYQAEHENPIYDPEAAREALKASRYGENLPAITLTVSGRDDSPRDDVTAIVEMWSENLGIDVKVEYLDPSEFSDTIREQHGSMVLSGWCADYPDPENFLDFLFHSESEFNFSGYSDAELDGLLVQARTELDPAKRLQLYQQIEARLLESYSAIPLFHSVNFVLVQPRVENFSLPALHTSYVLNLALTPGEEK